MAGPVEDPIDITKLGKYLQQALPKIQTPLKLKQFSGQSHLTYELTTANGKHYVLRKARTEPLPWNSSLQIEREFEILSALQGTDVPVPKVYLLCVDRSIIGTPFYIMERLHGRIFRDAALPGVSPEDRTEMWRDAVRILGRIHTIDPYSTGLQSFRSRWAYYSHQVSMLSQISCISGKTRNLYTKEEMGQLPPLEKCSKFFLGSQDELHRPESRTTLIHGDYQMSNLVFHETEPRIIGVLDWESSTLGHPLSDICTLTHPYFWNGPKRGAALLRSRTVEGLPYRAQCIQWYARLTGWNPEPDLSWGDAFFVFRMAVIKQNAGARYYYRQADAAKRERCLSMTMEAAEEAYEFLKRVTLNVLRL